MINIIKMLHKGTQKSYLIRDIVLKCYYSKSEGHLYELYLSKSFSIWY